MPCKRIATLKTITSAVVCSLIILQFASSCNETPRHEPPEPVARVDGSPVFPVQHNDVPKSGALALWRDFILVYVSILAPLRDALLVDTSGIAVESEQALGRSPSDAGADDPSAHSLIAHSIAFLEARLRQGMTDSPDQDKHSLQYLRDLASDDLSISTWKADRYLFRKYGGRVVRRPSPEVADLVYTIPIDAYRSWLLELENRNVWDLYTSFEDRFLRVMDVLPGDEELYDPNIIYCLNESN